MSFSVSAEAHLISRPTPMVLDVAGSTIEVLTAPTLDPSAPALMRNTLPGNAVVPLHAHPQAETFVVLAGAIEGLVVTWDEHTWVTVAEGQILHVPPLARHALRNVHDATSVQLVISAPPLAELFADVGVHIASVDSVRPPASAEQFRHMVQVGAERGYWVGTPEQNAEFGIELGAPPAG